MSLTTSYGIYDFSGSPIFPASYLIYLYDGFDDTGKTFPIFFSIRDFNNFYMGGIGSKYFVLPGFKLVIYDNYNYTVSSNVFDNSSNRILLYSATFYAYSCLLYRGNNLIVGPGTFTGTGGYDFDLSGGDVYITFYADGTLIPGFDISASTLLVGGGGSGGDTTDATKGGGGGGGGVGYGIFSLLKSTTYTIAIGAGGNGVFLGGGNVGGNTSIKIGATSLETAYGGGYGGHTSSKGFTGASSGGGAETSAYNDPGTQGTKGAGGGTITYYGNVGAFGSSSSTYAGGGGGAGSAGSGTNGGSGILWSGNGQYYGGGGGGGGGSGIGGIGGGGNGSGTRNATANTGGGGGGSGNGSGSGSGGSGIVIFKFRKSDIKSIT